MADHAKVKVEVVIANHAKVKVKVKVATHAKDKVDGPIIPKTCRRRGGYEDRDREVGAGGVCEMLVVLVNK